MRLTGWIAAALSLSARVILGQSAPVITSWTLTARTLDVGVDYAAGSLSGSSTITLRNTGHGAAVEVPLLLNRLMTVSRVTDARGAPVEFQQRFVLFSDDSTLQVNAISVTLLRPIAPGDSAVIVVHYGGHLTGYVETGSLYIQDHVDTAFTILREDAYAYPALGVPSRASNRAHGWPPFAFTARVTVPAGQVVAAGGIASPPEHHDSLSTFTYRSAAPSAFLNIAIARYHVLDRGGARIFYFPGDSTGAEMLARAVTGAIARYTAWYGPLGGTAQLTTIEIPDGWGSQGSLAGGIIQTAAAFGDRGELYQVYHELSHLWNVEDTDRPSPRWNEGLAMFLQSRMAAELDGWTGWDARLDHTAQRITRDCEPPAPCGTVPFAGYGKAELTDLSYSVGFAMFYALYRTLGADTFDRAYREFYQQHRRNGGSGAELEAAFHRASPKSDRIFKEWYDTTDWYQRLSRGESLGAIVASYGAP